MISLPLFKGWYAMYNQYAKNNNLLHGSNTKKDFLPEDSGLKCNIGDSV